PTQEAVAQIVRLGHRAGFDRPAETGPEHDRVVRPKGFEEIGNGFGRIGAIAVEEDGHVLSNRRDEFSERGSLAVSALDEYLGPEARGDRTRPVRGASVEQVDAPRQATPAEDRPRDSRH